MKELGWAVWITGLPMSGKSSITKALKEKLTRLGVEAQVLESDVIRMVLTPEPNNSPEESETFYNSLVYIGVLLTQNGVNIIFDATANKRKWRRAARGLIDDFIQVYIRCPLEVLRERAPKGTYEKATTMESTYILGPQGEYEEPLYADVELDCVEDSPETSADKIIKVMRENDFI